MLSTATNRDMRMEGTKFHVHARAEQGIVDLLPELMQPRMSGTDTDPEHARRPLLGERADTLDG
jgi:hypothetical protein